MPLCRNLFQVFYQIIAFVIFQQYDKCTFHVLEDQLLEHWVLIKNNKLLIVYFFVR